MDSNSIDSIDFEIAFSALLATTVTKLTTPYLQYSDIVEWMAIGLLLLTLIRRVGIVNQLDKKEPLFLYTNHLMKSISLVCLVYILFSISNLVYVNTGIGNGLIIFWIITIPIAIVIPVFQELTLGGGYMSEAQDAFSRAAEENQGTLGGKVWDFFESISKPTENIKSDVGKQAAIDDFDSKENTSKNVKIDKELLLSAIAHIFGTVLGLLLPIILYGIVATVMSRILVVSIYEALWTALCVLFLTGLTDIWFSKYGLIKVNETGWAGKAASVTAATVFSMLMLPL